MIANATPILNRTATGVSFFAENAWLLAAFGGLVNATGRVGTGECQTSATGTSPIFERVSRYSLPMSWPSTVTRPPLGVTMPQTMEISVVLPAPFGPSRP